MQKLEESNYKSSQDSTIELLTMLFKILDN